MEYSQADIKAISESLKSTIDYIKKMKVTQELIWRKADTKTSEGHGEYIVAFSKYAAFDNVLKMLEDGKRS